MDKVREVDEKTAKNTSAENPAFIKRRFLRGCSYVEQNAAWFGFVYAVL